MFRGFNGFEIDDIRNSGFGSGRDVGRGEAEVIQTVPPQVRCDSFFGFWRR